MHAFVALPLVAVIERQLHRAAAMMAVIVFLGEPLRGQTENEARREEGGQQFGPSEHRVSPLSLDFVLAGRLCRQP